MLRGQVRDVFCFGGDVDGCGGGNCVQRGEDCADFVVANGADDYQVIAFGRGGLPDVAGRQRDFGDTAIGLPAGGNGAREFSVVRDDQDAGVRQRRSPKESQRRRRRRSQKQSQRRPPKKAGGRCKCKVKSKTAGETPALLKSTAPSHFVERFANSHASTDQGCSFSASSMKERRRLVLMPRFTAASVFLARLACSTRPWKYETSAFASVRAAASWFRSPERLRSSVATARRARATTARRRSSAS